MRLRPGLAALWRRAGEIQIGDGPTQRAILSNLDRGVEQLIWALDHDQTPSRFQRMARAQGVSRQTAADLIAELTSVNALAVKQETRVAAQLSPATRQRLAGDASAWSLSRDDGRGWSLLAARAQRHVAVHGLDRTGLAIATHLAAAGVGHLRLTDHIWVAPDGSVADDVYVSAADIGYAGYRPGDQGQVRLSAATRLIRDSAPDIDITHAWTTDVDLAITVESRVNDPHRAAELLREEIQHLPVLLRETDAVIGPWIRPGQGPCLRCLHLQHSEADECWPALATQLAGLRETSPVVESSVRDVTVAHVVAQALAIVDRQESVLAGATLQIGLPDVLARRRRWSAHPDCGCADLPDAAVRPPACEADRGLS